MGNAVAKKDYSTVRVHLSYNNNANIAYFDSMFLYKDTIQSYVYDANGNVVSVVDNASKQSTFDYTNNNLSKILSPTGTCYEYLYDSKKNVTRANSSEGVNYSLNYDSYGNPISTSVGSDNYSTSLKSGKTYYIRNKSTGKYIANDLKQYDYSSGTDRQWLIETTDDGAYVIKSVANGNAINFVYSGGFSVNCIAPINAIQQKFAIIPNDDGTYRIIGKGLSDGYEGYALTVSGNTAGSSLLIDHMILKNALQSWYFEDVSTPVVSSIENGGIYQFRVRHSGKYIDVNGMGTTDGTYLTQQEQSFGQSQKFILTQYQTNYYTITPIHAQDKLLSVSSTQTVWGNKQIVLANNTVDDTKLFEFLPMSDGTFQIRCKAYPDVYFDIAYGSYDNGSQLITTPGNGLQYPCKCYILEKVSQSITSTATYQDSGNYLASTTDSRGNTTSYTYNTTNGNLDKVTNAKSIDTTYTYDGLGRTTGVSSSGVSNAYSYSMDQLSSITHNGFSYNFIYDAYGNTKQIKVGNQSLIENQYEANNGKLLNSIYGNGITLSYVYDQEDQVTEKKYNNVTQYKYKYDNTGNLYEQKDLGNNVKTTYQYDLTKRLLGFKTNSRQNLSLNYDTNNRLSKLTNSIDGTNTVTSYNYNDKNLIDSVKTTSNGSTLVKSYVFDSLSRLSQSKVSTNLGNEFVTSYKYVQGKTKDQTTSLISSVTNRFGELNYEYDALGNITTIRLNGVPKSVYTYDNLNQLTSETNNNVKTTYTYDNGGNILTRTTNGVTTNWTYGNANWKDLLTSYNGQTITYDAIGNPLQYRDGMSLTWMNGRQLSTLNKTGLSTSYQYNDNGIRTKKTVNGVSTEFFYNGSDLVSEKRDTSLIGKGTAYDNALTNPTGEDETKAFDDNANTKWLIYQSTGVLTYKLSSNTSTIINSYAITSANDASERDPKSWTLQGTLDGTNWVTLDSQSNVSFADRNERKVYTFKSNVPYLQYRINITANNGSTQYTQLAEFELMQVQDSTLNFALSSKGTVSDAGLTNPTGEEEANAIDSNSKTKWLVYQSTGMLTYTFNSTTSSNKLNCYAITSANDSSDRDPKSWKLEGSTDGTNWTTLDTQTNITFSNRYEREVFRFTNDCNYQYYRLNITANNGSTQYTQLADFELMMVAGDQIDYAYDEDGNLYGFYYNGIPYIYVRNGQNDITGILDSNGNQVVSYDYDSWGKVISVTGSMASTIGERNPFRYRGYYYDTETGMYYLQSRYYDPQTGRFINADTIDSTIENNDDILSGNLFVYCTNNPVNYSDPDGTWKLPNWAKLGIGAAAIAIGVAATVATGGAAAPALIAALQVAGGSAAIGALVGGITGGTRGALNGACDGFMWGGIGAGASMVGKAIKGTKAFIAVRGTVSQTRAVQKLISAASKLKYSKTALSHLSSRPYMNSTLTIKEIMKAARPVADASLKNGYKWVVSGTYNGTKGTWELVVDASTNTIVHFLFKS